MIEVNVERAIGVLIAIIAIGFFMLYAYLLLFSSFKEMVLSISVLTLVGIVVGAVVWLGITIAKTPRNVKDR